MNLFKNLGTQGLEESQDRLGGFQVYESDIYPVTIKALYAGESKGGAMSLNLIADIQGKEYRETFYITNKNKENFFINKQSGKKSPLPGFTVANDLCLMATDKELADLDTEEKVIKVYDFEEKKELPKAVQMITEAIGKTVHLGIIKRLVNKNEKDASGEYVATSETREENLTDKVFHPELHLTVAEARQGKTKLEEAAFYDAWLKRNKGQTQDKREIKDGEAPKGGTPPKAGGKGAPASSAKASLFGPKK